ncbi:F510_1955 family glycosylhydrolase [Halobacillus sp. MO56]
MIKKLLLITSLSIGLILTGCNQTEEGSQTEENTQIDKTEQTDTQKSKSNTQSNDDMAEFLQPFDGSVNHVHGIGYMNPETGVAFASHTGLKFYKDGKWQETKGQYNDYMGFTAVEGGFYTSGHPGKDSDLPNPLGLKKSFDGGQSMENLGFEGESDFHTMGVGYKNHAIYLMNMEPNSKLEAGFYRSLDDGETWESVAADGLSTSPFAIAVHPTDENIIAASTQNGVYLSENGGKSFEPLKENTQGTALYFEEDTLYYATYSNEPTMEAVSLEDRSTETISLPDIGQQAILYIAKNPASDEEFTILSSNGETDNAYRTTDKGSNWQQIIDKGKPLSK